MVASTNLPLSESMHQHSADIHVLIDVQCTPMYFQQCAHPAYWLLESATMWSEFCMGAPQAPTPPLGVYQVARSWYKHAGNKIVADVRTFSGQHGDQANRQSQCSDEGLFEREHCRC